MVPAAARRAQGAAGCPGPNRARKRFSSRSRPDGERGWWPGEPRRRRAGVPSPRLPRLGARGGRAWRAHAPGATRARCGNLGGSRSVRRRCHRPPSSRSTPPAAASASAGCGAGSTWTSGPATGWRSVGRRARARRCCCGRWPGSTRSTRARCGRAGRRSPTCPRHRAAVAHVAQRPALFDGTVRDNLQAPFAFAVRAGAAYDEAPSGDAPGALGRDAEMLDQSVDGLSGGEVADGRAGAGAPHGPRRAAARRADGRPRPRARRRPSRPSSPTFSPPTRLAAAVWTSHDAAQLDRVTTRALDL